MINKQSQPVTYNGFPTKIITEPVFLTGWCIEVLTKAS